MIKISELDTSIDFEQALRQLIRDTAISALNHVLEKDDRFVDELTQIVETQTKHSLELCRISLLFALKYSKDGQSASVSKFINK